MGKYTYPYVTKKQEEYQERLNNEPPRCPRCGSTYLSADKKGFSATKGAIGAMLFDDILVGAIIGSHGSDKVILTCLKCGKQWKAGK